MPALEADCRDLGDTYAGGQNLQLTDERLCNAGAYSTTQSWPESRSSRWASSTVLLSMRSHAQLQMQACSSALQPRTNDHKALCPPTASHGTTVAQASIFTDHSALQKVSQLTWACFQTSGRTNWVKYGTLMTNDQPGLRYSRIHDGNAIRAINEPWRHFAGSLIPFAPINFYCESTALQENGTFKMRGRVLERRRGRADNDTTQENVTMLDAGINNIWFQPRLQLQPSISSQVDQLSDSIIIHPNTQFQIKAYPDQTIPAPFTFYCTVQQALVSNHHSRHLLHNSHPLNLLFGQSNNPHAVYSSVRDSC